MQLEHSAAGTTARASEPQRTRLVWDQGNRQVFADLSTAMLQPRPVVVLIGEEGSGKTALLNEWAADCDGAIYLARPGPMSGGPDEVMSAVAAAFDVKAESTDKNALTAALRAKLTTLADLGDIPVLLVDDADKLDANTIELLRLFASIRHNGMPLMRLVLGGRPILRRLAKADNEHAGEAITVIEMGPLSSDAAENLVFQKIREMTGDRAEIEPGVAAAVARLGGDTPGQLVAAAAKVGAAALEGGWARIGSDRAARLISATPEPDPIADSGFDIHPAEQPEAASDDVSTTGKLPSSIREAEDPRMLLRWAFGLRKDDDKPADTGRAAPEPAAPKPDNTSVAPKVEEPKPLPTEPTAPIAPQKQVASPPPVEPRPAPPAPSPPVAEQPPTIEMKAPPAEPTPPSQAQDAASKPPEQGRPAKITKPFRFPDAVPAYITSPLPSLPVRNSQAKADAAPQRPQPVARPPASPPPQATQPAPPPVQTRQPAPPPPQARQPEPAPQPQARPKAPLPPPPQAAQPRTAAQQQARKPGAAPVTEDASGTHIFESSDADELLFPEPDADLNAALRRVVAAEQAEREESAAPAPQQTQPAYEQVEEGAPSEPSLVKVDAALASVDLPPLAAHVPETGRGDELRAEQRERTLREAFAVREEPKRSYSALYFAGAFAAGLALAFVGWPMLKNALQEPAAVAENTTEDIPAISVGTANADGTSATVQTAAAPPADPSRGPELTAIVEEIRTPDVNERVVVSGFASLDGTGVRVPAQDVDPSLEGVTSAPEPLSGIDVGMQPQIQPGAFPGRPGTIVGGEGTEELVALMEQKAALENQIASLTTERNTIISELPQLQQQVATLSGQSSELDARLGEQSAVLARAEQDAAALREQAAEAGARRDNLTAEISALETELSSLSDNATTSANLAAEASSLEDQRKVLTSEVSELQTQQKVLEAELNATRGALASEQRALDQLRIEQEKAALARDEAESELLVLQAEVDATTLALKEAEDARAQTRAEGEAALAAGSVPIEEIATARGEAESELATINGAIEIGREELSTIEESIAARRAALDAPISEGAGNTGSAEAKVAALRDEAAALEASIESARGKLASVSDERANAAAVSDELDELMASRVQVRENLERARLELAAEEKRFSDERAAMETEIVELTSALDARREEMANAEGTVASLNERLADLSDQTAVEEAKFAQLREKVDAELEDANARLLAARQAADSETARLNNAAADFQDVETRRAEAVAALEEAKARFEREREERQGALLTEQAAIEEDISSAKDQLANLTQEAQAQQDRLSGAAEERLRLEAEIASLKEQLTSEQSALRANLETLSAEEANLAASVESKRAELQSLEASNSGRSTNDRGSTIVTERRDALLDEVAAAEQTLAALRADISSERRTQSEDLGEMPVETTPGPKPAFPIVSAAKTPPPRGGLPAARTEAKVEVEQAATAPADATPAARVARDAQEVREVLASLPEFNRLSGDQRTTLEKELIDGACLTEALQTAAGRINRLMLAGLMRKLDMCTG